MPKWQAEHPPQFGDKVNQYIVEGDGRPSALQAELFRRMSHATVLENDWYEYLPMWSSVKRVGEVLGAGVELYFRLLRMMFFCFLFLFVVAYLWIYIANYATFFDKSGSPFALNRPMLFPENGGSTMQLAGASLAAIPVQKDATIREATDSRLEYEIKGSGVYEISHGELLYFIEAMTLLNGLLIYLFIQFTRFRSSRVLRRVDEASIEVSDYTVRRGRVSIHGLGGGWEGRDCPRQVEREEKSRVDRPATLRFTGVRGPPPARGGSSGGGGVVQRALRKGG